MTADFKAMRPGIALATFSILLGFSLGGVFGIAEDSLKGRLEASAGAVRETVYGGDEARIQKTLDKSWVYLQRAHLHSGAIGTAALAMSLLLGFLDIRAGWKAASSLLLGLGAVGYGQFWFWAGMRAPGLGGTGVAKESLAWLGMPSAAMCLVGAALTLSLCVGASWSRDQSSG
jgi:hypothetical protein